MILDKTEVKPKDNKRVLYRYEDEPVHYGYRIVCNWYLILKETPCGVWIHRYPFNGTATYEDSKKWKAVKFVKLNAYKKWAHLTKKEAFNAFVHRKLRQKQIILSQLKRVTSVLSQIEDHKQNE